MRFGRIEGDFSGRRPASADLLLLPRYATTKAFSRAVTSSFSQAGAEVGGGDTARLAKSASSQFRQSAKAAPHEFAIKADVELSPDHGDNLLRRYV